MPHGRNAGKARGTESQGDVSFATRKNCGDVSLARLWLCGLWLLFRIPDFASGRDGFEDGLKDVSIIIPARDEEKRLPGLLKSIGEQGIRVKEIIFVDDQSTDRTGEIHAGYGVTIVRGKPLPPGWQGRSWALWQTKRPRGSCSLCRLPAAGRHGPDQADEMPASGSNLWLIEQVV